MANITTTIKKSLILSVALCAVSLQAHASVESYEQQLRKYSAWEDEEKNAGDGENPCDVNQRTMNECSFRTLIKVDEALNKTYQKKMKSLGSDAQRRSLRKAERAWMRFRDAACLKEVGPMAEGGTIWAMEWNGCMTRHSLQRLHDLDER